MTVVETPGRGKAFWLGLLVGVLAVALAVVVMWLLGVIDVGGRQKNDESTVTNVSNDIAATSNDTAVNNQTSNLENITNDVAEEEERAANASPYYVDAVLAKNVDDQARPVDETSTFAEDDSRFYLIITLSDDIPADTEVGVEWFQGSAKLSDYSTKVDDGQSVAYFFATNPGDAGDYSVKVLFDGTESDTLKFSVQ